MIFTGYLDDCALGIIECIDGLIEPYKKNFCVCFYTTSQHSVDHIFAVLAVDGIWHGSSVLKCTDSSFTAVTSYYASLYKRAHVKMAHPHYILLDEDNNHLYEKFSWQTIKNIFAVYQH